MIKSAYVMGLLQNYLYHSVKMITPLKKYSVLHHLSLQIDSKTALVLKYILDEHYNHVWDYKISAQIVKYIIQFFFSNYFKSTLIVSFIGPCWLVPIKRV